MGAVAVYDVTARLLTAAAAADASSNSTDANDAELNADFATLLRAHGDAFVVCFGLLNKRANTLTESQAEARLMAELPPHPNVVQVCCCHALAQPAQQLARRR